MFPGERGDVPFLFVLSVFVSLQREEMQQRLRVHHVPTPRRRSACDPSAEPTRLRQSSSQCKTTPQLAHTLARWSSFFSLSLSLARLRPRLLRLSQAGSGQACLRLLWVERRGLGSKKPHALRKGSPSSRFFLTLSSFSFFLIERDA